MSSEDVPPIPPLPPNRFTLTPEPPAGPQPVVPLGQMVKPEPDPNGNGGNGQPQPQPPRQVNEVSLSDRIKALKERVKTIRDGTLLMRSAVLNPEPGKRYLWVGVHQDRRTFFEAIGWQVVRNPDKTRRSYDPAMQEHRRGDVVLYQIDEEEADAIEKYNIVRGLEAAGQDVETSFAAAAERHGVKTFRPPI